MSEKLSQGRVENTEDKSEQFRRRSYAEHIIEEFSLDIKSEEKLRNLLAEVPPPDKLADIFHTKFNVDLREYSPESREGLGLFLSGMKGFQEQSLDEFASISPVHAKFVMDLPQDKRDDHDFVSAHFINDDFKTDLMKSFSLFIDHSETLKTMILGRLYANYYGETINRELGDEAVKIIGELADVNQSIVEQVQRLCADSEKQAEIVTEITNNLRDEAVKFIDEVFGNELYELIQEDPENYYGYAGVFSSRFEKYRSDKKLFLESFKILKKNDLIDFEKLSHTSFETKKSSQITDGEFDQMEEILKLNWQTQSGDFYQALLAGLIAARKGSSTFYILKYDNQVVGFNRFDDHLREQDNPHIYFGSFNTHPEYGNAKLGEALYEESLRRELEKNVVIEADCDPFSPITQKYIQSGFVATNFYLYGGKPSFHITYNSKYESLQSHTLETQEIIKIVEAGETPPENLIVREITNDDTFPELDNHRILARYLSVKINEKVSKLYGVFEPEPS